MKKVLLVSDNKDEEMIILNSLNLLSIEEIVKVKTTSAAQDKLDADIFDLCIINSPLADNFGGELARNIISQSICQVILITGKDYFIKTARKNEGFGVYVIAKPLKSVILNNTLMLSNAAHNKMVQITEQSERLKQRLEDEKIINRAKCILIEYLKLSEHDAHKYIEKQAMDLRITKKQMAQNILKTYEN